MSAVPHWAVQRVASALEEERVGSLPPPTIPELARRTGLSRRMVRQCLLHARTQTAEERLRATRMGL